MTTSTVLIALEDPSLFANIRLFIIKKYVDKGNMESLSLYCVWRKEVWCKRFHSIYWNVQLWPMYYVRKISVLQRCTLLGLYGAGTWRSSTLSTYPPPYLPGYWGFSLLVALNKDGPGQWSGHLQAAQPRTCGPWKMYVNIVLYFPSSNTVFWNAYQMSIKRLSA